MKEFDDIQPWNDQAIIIITKEGPAISIFIPVTHVKKLASLKGYHLIPRAKEN